MTAAAGGWRDHRDQPVQRPAAPGPDRPSFYLPMMALQGASYDRNAFAMGTAAEVVALTARLGLRAGTRVLDVGCGTGRHLRALATDPGVVGLGVDVTPELVAAARAHQTPGVRFAVGDARRLLDVPAVAEEVADGGFDVVWTLCQGGFGTSPASDPDVLAGLAAACRPGGVVVVTAFHALFAVRHLVEGDAYDPLTGTHHQVTEVRGPDHARERFDLWTTAWTVREITTALTGLGLLVREVVGCEPGRYDGTSVALDDPELLVVATRPA